jgi:protein O-mannosyl-transferase
MDLGAASQREQIVSGLALSMDQAEDREMAVQRYARLLSLALVLVTVLLYLPVRWNQFINYDDPAYVTQNPVVKAGLTGPGVWLAFTSSHAVNWHPVTWLSHMLDCQLFGLDAGAHHLVSAALHAANAGLLVILLFRLTGSLYASAFAAALFAWHPLRVESVAWVSERKDVLSAFFGFLSLLAYERYARQTDRAKRIPYYVLALVLFASGLMSKPMLVTLPFVMLLLDIWPLCRCQGHDVPSVRSSLRPLVMEKWPFFLLSAACSVITFLTQRQAAVVSLRDCPLGLRLANSVVSYVRYLFKTVCPTSLAVIYPYPKGWAWPQVIGAAVLLLAIGWLAWHTLRRRPHIAIGYAWFLGTLVPVIGLVQVGWQAMADRYMYIPQIGLFVMVAFEACYWAERYRISPWFLTVAAGVVLAGCLAGTARQLQYWRDTESLFTHTIAVTRDNVNARMDLGVALADAGRNQEAVSQYQEVLRLAPRMRDIHDNLAIVLDRLGKQDEALTEYAESLRMNPTPATHEAIGQLLVRLGRFEEAARHYAEASRLAPDRSRPHYLMGRAMLLRGQTSEALASFRQALRRNPDDVQSLVWMARVLAIDGSAAVRNGADALTAANRANALSGGGRSDVLDTLAMAYAENGRFAEAREAVKKAIELAANAKWTNDVLDMQPRLLQYELHQAYRGAFTNTIR